MIHKYNKEQYSNSILTIFNSNDIDKFLEEIIETILEN
jgi:hypothetical protein